MDTIPPHYRALSKAKIALMSQPDSAFFTTVCFSLKHVWSERVPTAATDGTTIYFNPEFFLSLDQQEQLFLILHETMHVAYLHMDRVQTRNKNKWNMAADHVINLMLIERGFKMPEDGLADPQYKGMSTEEVYNAIPDEEAESFDPDLSDLLEPGEGSSEEGSTESPATPALTSEQLQEHVQDILVRAALQSKLNDDAIGTIPGEIQIFLDNLLDPKLPWNRILQKYLHTFAKNDYSWRRPNRRYFPEYILPSLYSQNLAHLAIAIDTSGSVSDHDFKIFVSEVASILRMMKPEKMTLVQFDTQIKSVDTLHQVNDLYGVNFKGRGGTEIEPVMHWVQDNKPQLMLVFTDGHFRFYDARPPTKAPLLWVIHNNKSFSPPYGKTIHYSL